MYKAKYCVETEKTSEGKEKTKTTLDAKFRFRKETAPKDREEIKERIKLKNLYLPNYLKNEGFYLVSGKAIYASGESPKLELFIGGFSSLRLNLKVKAKGKVALEKMFDLDALNNFILTGEIKEPEQK